MKEFTSRALTNADAEIICLFPQSPEELFYMGPKFVYPLTVDQVLQMAERRSSATVIADGEDRPVAYANLYDVNQEQSLCYLGNVIISTAHRGKGISDFLLQKMMASASNEHKLKRMRLYCHNTNTKALLFYARHGFVPCGIKVMKNHADVTVVSIEMEKHLD